MNRDRSWKKADYPNRKPSWQKSRGYSKRNKETTAEMVRRVLKTLDYNKLATIGKE